MSDVSTLYPENVFPIKELYGKGERCWSVSVLIVDEWQNPIAGYYNFCNHQWFSVDDEPIEQVSFKWCYMPSWFKF